MARVDKDYQMYLEGLQKALKIAKEKSIEELENEVTFRGRTRAPVSIPKKTVEDFERRVKRSTTESVVTLAAWVLHHEFGYGKKRLEHFIEVFNNDAECLSGDFINWEDVTKALSEECGIKRTLHWD